MIDEPDDLPEYATLEAPQQEDQPPLRFRDVVDLVVDMSLLGIVFGLLLSAPSNYAKLLLIPLGLFGWRAGKRLVEQCRRVFSA